MFDANQLPMPDLGLICRECGYPLAHLLEHRCPECGWVFTADDLVPPGDFVPLYADGGPVRGTPQVIALLKRYQLPFVPQVDPSVGVFGLVRTSRQVGDPLAVPRDVYLEAVDLLRRVKLGEPMPPVPPTADPDEIWPCPQCGEENPGNFEICWQCQHTGPSPASL